MQPVVAHAGEEVLFVLIPVLLILVLVQVGKRRTVGDEQGEKADRTEGTDPPE